MKIRLSAPSKTFLLGEYLILEGGQALVLGTKPRFTLQANAKGDGRFDGINPASPGGRYLQENPLFSKWDISFTDPHDMLGGFGASSAQFLLLFCLNEMIERGEFLATEPHESPLFSLRPGFLDKMWHEYRDYSEGGAKPPSGADVLSQLVGGVSQVQLGEIQVRAREWNFKDYDFILARTGNKLATHTHLRSLKEFDPKPLQAALDIGLSAFESGSGEQLATAIQAYHRALTEFGFVAHETAELVDTLASTEAVEAVKGCGAMGADVLFILFKKENEAIVRDRMNLIGLSAVATSKDLSYGLRINVESKRKPSARGLEL